MSEKPPFCAVCCPQKTKQNGNSFYTTARLVLARILILVCKGGMILGLAVVMRLAEVYLAREYRSWRLLTHSHNFTLGQDDLLWEGAGNMSPPNFIINKRSSLKHKFDLTGCIFMDTTSQLHTEIQTEMTSSLVHKFSPYLEERVRAKFVDPPTDNSFYVLSPAVALRGGQLHIFSRVMVDRMRYRFTKPQRFPLNQFLTNYILHESFSGELNPLGGGSLLGIPTPIFPMDGDGAMDPRVFQLRDKLYLMVLLFTYIEDKLWKPHPLIWDVEESRAILPTVDLTYNEHSPMEKNWSPVVVNDTLYLVHNLDPLRMLRCDLEGPGASCQFVVDEAGSGGFTFERRRHTLRGGTPFVLYQWPYYISLAHSVVIRQRPHAPFGRVRRYEANIVVLRADHDFRLVYVSNALQFNPRIYTNNTMVYYEGQILVENSFVYPVSIIPETNDSVIVGSHVNDHVSVLMRLTGFKGLMDQIQSREKSTRRRVVPMDVQNFVRRNFPPQPENTGL